MGNMMGLFNLFSFSQVPKVAKGNKILLVEEYNKKLVKVIDDIHDFYVDILEKDPSHKLLISASLNGKFIPIIDCDSNPERQRAIEFLKSNNMRYATFQSSRYEHYWIVVDASFEKFLDAWNFICYVPGNDHRYLKYTKQLEYFAIRGEYKESNDAPKLIHISCQNPDVCTFVDLMDEHFKDMKRLNAIASAKCNRKLFETSKSRSY